MDIETVAEKSPEKIMREPVDPLAGLQAFQTRKLAKQLGFESSQMKAAAKFSTALFRTFIALRLLDGGSESARRHDRRASCSRSMRNSISMTTRFTGIRSSRRCAT